MYYIKINPQIIPKNTYRIVNIKTQWAMTNKKETSLILCHSRCTEYPQKFEFDLSQHRQIQISEISKIYSNIGLFFLPKTPPTSFSLVTSKKDGISSQKLWILVLTLYPHQCKILSSCLVPVTNYWT